MNRNRRNQRSNWLTMAAVLAVVSFGCGETESAGSSPAVDAGSAAARRRSGGDLGVNGSGGAEAPNFADALGDNPALFADPLRNPGDFPGMSTDAAEGAQEYADAALACYATPDACGGPECSAFASCCVNTGACCAPLVDNAALPALLDFRGCGLLDLLNCAEASSTLTTTFGELEPVLNARGLVPNGTANAEGGALIGEPVNLASQRVELDVQFALPVGCSGTCLESAGVAFTATAPGAFVDAEVGLLLSGSREQVNVMIGNEVADSFFAGPGSTRWRLVLSPDGAAALFRDGVLQGRYAFDAAALSQAQLVAFGRNLSATANSAAIASIEVQVADCDNPRAWSERQPVSVSIGVSDAERHTFGAGPSIVDLGQTKQVAYELDGAIYVGELVTPGEVFVAVPAPVLIPSGPGRGDGPWGPRARLRRQQRVPVLHGARGERRGEHSRSGVGFGAFGVHADRGAGLDSGRRHRFVRGADGRVPGGALAAGGSRNPFGRRDRAPGLLHAQPRRRLGTGGERRPRTAHAHRERHGRNHRAEPDDSQQRLPALLRAPQRHALVGGAFGFGRAPALAAEWVTCSAAATKRYDSLGARSPDVISGPDRIDIVYSGQDGVAFRLGTASRTAPSATAPSIF